MDVPYPVAMRNASTAPAVSRRLILRETRTHKKWGRRTHRTMLKLLSSGHHAPTVNALVPQITPSVNSVTDADSFSAATVTRGAGRWPRRRDSLPVLAVDANTASRSRTVVCSAHGHQRDGDIRHCMCATPPPDSALQRPSSLLCTPLSWTRRNEHESASALTTLLSHRHRAAIMRTR